MTAGPEDGAWPVARKLAWIEQLGRDPTLSALALRLALILATKYVNSATGEAWPGQDTLAADLGATPDGLRKAAHQLEARGHVAVTRPTGRGRSNRYRPLPIGGDVIEKPRHASGLSDHKTPTPVRVIEAKTPTPVVENPDARRLKTPTRVGPIPLEEPLEELSGGKRRAATRCETAIPDGYPDDEAVNRERDFLRREGWNIDARLEAASFRAHAETHDRRVKMWTAAFHSWILGAIRMAAPSARIAPVFVANEQRDPAYDPWRVRVQAFADRSNRHWNTTDWGPSPGKPGCTVPPAILAEFGFRPENAIPLGRLNAT